MLPERQIGRLPTPEVRREVADFAAVCRKALSSPERRACANPEAPVEERSYVHADEVLEFALRALERFGEHGDHFRPDWDINRMVIRGKVSGLRKSGLSFEEAVGAVADDLDVDDRTVSRFISHGKS
ncbi:hypothetical protein HHL21_09050 [Massilia sp. RP-1-19]|uniref:Uncharacterized protein n=1 Tax=Massilia polaris TaxID=2728846 RepID=A0A848HJ45_9BURK|nr:hypothetical protein [Massilia polaris]NML61224.1 hypothetical protein [Massilia polaris]